MIKAAIFDLNGVFITSEPLSKRFEEKFGISVDDFLPALKEVMDQVRKPNSPDTFSLWKPHLDKWKVNLTEDEFFNFWFSGEHVAPKLVNYIGDLKNNGLKVLVLSNNFKERTTYYRQNFSEVFNDLDGSYFSWETGLVKPDPEAYKKILTDNNLKPEECIYFDDSNKNIEVARRLGIHAERYEGFEAIKNTIERLTTPHAVERK
jgi:HAD superfamily hydrolase (TIGR01509 family)